MSASLSPDQVEGLAFMAWAGFYIHSGISDKYIPDVNYQSSWEILIMFLLEKKIF